MSGASLFSEGDSVVLVDARGALERDGRGRPLRGVVVYISWPGQIRVCLDRTGRLVTVDQLRVRRCPELAYVRPRAVAGGAL